ncbi:GntR family transcriptional regulator [Verrucomicrobiaceae bacterium 5K15]|uniref:GntR family transcriptional regulator n=1 Tax=Oceaniferula flava TaxID=2800421 RepID=A0AAE2SCN8_9BACT|nr:S1-like domain-containing RNA-binding protein [Oceaniferula flavus]MBK1855428.1 GntR family transcriptional regulator [Oceaniferula flavus]MBM1136734.1 GntR family transcriptional regulator [Oceaniferula flavus]
MTVDSRAANAYLIARGADLTYVARMADIGERARLKVLRESGPGLFLDSEGVNGEILLPRHETTGDVKLGEAVEVFLYCDSEDRPIATMRKPLAMPGEFATLRCVNVTPIGSFLDWGLAKDLLVPFREQLNRLDVGKSYAVYVYVDEKSGRIVASRRITRFLKKERPDYEVGQEVDLRIFGKTDLGYKAIINGEYAGVLFANEVFQDLQSGEQTVGYITGLRADGKVDLSLYKPGQAKIDDLEARIEEELDARGGYWELCDASPAEVIYAELGVSKKAFKRATGALFRKRRITIGKDGIRQVK